MAYEKKPNSGSLWRNEDKDPDDERTKNYSDYKGTALIDGVEYFLDAWLNEAQGEQNRLPSGKQKKYFGIKFKPKQQQSEGYQQTQQASPVQAEDEDVPF